MAVVRVDAIRECRAGRRQRDAGLLGQRHSALGRAVRRHQIDEIAALRMRPRHAGHIAQMLLELRQHRVKLRLEQLAMLFHQCLDRRQVLQEAHMAQLVDLVRADAAEARVPAPPGDIGRRRRQRRHARAGPSDLRRRRKHKRAVRIAGLLAGRQD
ncbi:conserved hypothetical protein, partial [Ricinus communis]